MNSNPSSTASWRDNILYWIIAGFALLGLADSIYLTVEHYAGLDVTCLVVEGCETVLTSKYSEISGIPLALFGIIFYAGVFIIANWQRIERTVSGGRFLLYAGIVGFSASMFFLYLQLYVIGALCFYCLLSVFTSTAIFIASLISYRLNRPSELK